MNYSLKCGYKITGRQKEEKFKFGTYHDVIMLEVFRDEWEIARDVWIKSQNKKTTPKKTKG